MSPGCCSDPVSSSVHLSSMLVSGFASAPFLSALVLGPLLALLLAAYPALVVLSPELVHARGDELRWRSPWGDGLLPVIGDAPTVQLSIVVPAYNEAARLPKMLDETLAALASREPLVGGGATGEASAAVTLDEALSGALDTVEVLVVDDGSSDGTAEVVLAHAREHKEQWGRTECRVVRLARNRGKGGAVRHGVLHARGALILFADADGATTFSALRPLAQELARIRTPAGHGIAVGSRAHLVGSEAVVKRSFVRNFLMHGFHLFLSLLLRPPSPQALLARYLPVKATHTALPAQPLIQDTQCGFKLFTRASARTAFEGMHINRWIFDVEALLRAEMASQTALRRVALRGGMAAVRAKEATGKSAEVGTDSAEDPLLLLPLPIAEVPVEWTEVDGSKIDLLKDSVGMALDLLVIRANYALGRWPRPPPARVDAAETCAR